jgi:glutaredoxin-like protein
MAAMLDEKVKTQVSEVFQGLSNPVEVLFFGSADEENCQYCSETRQLLEEVTDLSDQVTLKVYDLEKDADLAKRYKVDGAPGYVMVGREGGRQLDYGIRFKGIPAGHEFTSLINDLVLVSQRDSNLSEETRTYLRGLKQPVHLQVFVTPTCPYCPRAVVLAHQMALESPMVEAEMVEAMEFPDLADRFNVSGVPQITINMGAGTVVGAVPENILVTEIEMALEKTVVK